MMCEKASQIPSRIDTGQSTTLTTVVRRHSHLSLFRPCIAPNVSIRKCPRLNRAPHIRLFDPEQVVLTASSITALCRYLALVPICSSRGVVGPHMVQSARVFNPWPEVCCLTYFAETASFINRSVFSFCRSLLIAFSEGS